MRQAAIAVENSFNKGHITEASGLNFPENACTETFDCIHNFDGSVDRRPGFDFEDGYAEKTINRSGSVVSAYLWKNVSGNGDITLLVLQVGGTIYFYETQSDAISGGAVSSNITLSTYNVSGAPTPETQECQFSAGNGKLFVTHPYCEPFYVTYNTSTQVVTGTEITIKIRDFEGDSADSNAVDTRPTTTLASMDVSHKYNLYNQGWNTTNLTAWDTSETTMPSNADVMWAFKNSSDAFAAATIPNVINGNSPAPKGHFILELADQDRDTASGLSGVTGGGTDVQRPSTSAFFTGRVFYSGINYVGYNSKIYYTQIVERDEQYGFCYQQNDPTAEDAFDLLPADGGVISIPEAGTVFKLFSIAGALLVFAQNGVWSVTGSTGVGFSATDYTVSKLSSVSTVSATSFVDVAGYPCWWNYEGIYIIGNGQNSLSVESLTLTKNQAFYDAIPSSCKRTARGYYNLVSKKIQWIYRNEAGAIPEEIYEFDRIMNFDTRTQSFYYWRVPDGDVKINSLIVLDGSTGSLTANNIIDDSANNVVDDSGNSVVAYTSSNSESVPSFVYIVSFAEDASYQFTMASARNTSYLDWFQYDDLGVSFESYIITGYRLRGQGIKDWQSQWIEIFSKTEEAVQYKIQARWDYSVTGDTGRWSSVQTVSHNDTDFLYSKTRRKIPGHGLAMQLKVSSVSGQPFHITGWTTFDTINATP